MLAVSQKINLNEEEVVPKVLDFAKQRREEDTLKQLRDEQFERLHALAYQPSLHNTIFHSSNDDEDEWWKN